MLGTSEVIVSSALVFTRSMRYFEEPCVSTITRIQESYELGTYVAIDIRNLDDE